MEAEIYDLYIKYLSEEKPDLTKYPKGIKKKTSREKTKIKYDTTSNGNNGTMACRFNRTTTRIYRRKTICYYSSRSIHEMGRRKSVRRYGRIQNRKLYQR